MQSVACLVANASSAHDFGVRLRGRAQLRLFDDRAALAAHVRAGDVAAVVVDLRDATGRPTTGTVRALRNIAPGLPLFARCRLEEADCRALLDFARAGGTDVVVHGTAYAPLLAALAPASTGADAHALVDRLLGTDVAPSIAAILARALDHVADPAALTIAARACGLGPRVLRRRLASAQLPPPRALRGALRVLAAAHRLHAAPTSVERVAHDVGFSSGNALRNALHRVGGATPSSLRAAAGLDAFIVALRARLVAPRGRRAAIVAERTRRGARYRVRGRAGAPRATRRGRRPAARGRSDEGRPFGCASRQARHRTFGAR
jgi:AraC-like DNA-binding protein